MVRVQSRGRSPVSLATLRRRYWTESQSIVVPKRRWTWTRSGRTRDGGDVSCRSSQRRRGPSTHWSASEKKHTNRPGTVRLLPAALVQ